MNEHIDNIHIKNGAKRKTNLHVMCNKHLKSILCNIINSGKKERTIDSRTNKRQAVFNKIYVLRVNSKT